MDQEQLETLLAEIAEQAFADHCLLVALLQKLIDSKAFKGLTEAEVMDELDARAKDIREEETRDVRLKERARIRREAWSKLPKQ